ncbi:MAG: DegV family protein [Bacilli bacterium]
MEKYVILGDSTCDLGKDLREKYNIDYCRMFITRGDKDYPASLDYDEYSAKELYDWMRNGERVFTSQVPEAEFVSVFTKYLDKGLDILYISCSSALSASIKTALKVKQDLEGKYKERKIVCIDSLISSLGQGSMLIKASELRSEGKTIEEVREVIESTKLKYRQWGCCDDLNYLKRAGRVKASSAFFGNMFGIKPIIISDIKGRNYAYKKVKGLKNAMIDMVNSMVQEIEKPEEQIIYISHADCIEYANMIKEEVLKRIKPKGIYINYIGPIVGSSVGPGTVILYCYGKAETIDGGIN